MIKSRLCATLLSLQAADRRLKTEFKVCRDLVEMNALVWRDESLGLEWASLRSRAIQGKAAESASLLHLRLCGKPTGCHAKRYLEGA